MKDRPSSSTFLAGFQTWPREGVETLFQKALVACMLWDQLAWPVDRQRYGLPKGALISPEAKLSNRKNPPEEIGWREFFLLLSLCTSRRPHRCASSEAPWPLFAEMCMDKFSLGMFVRHSIPLKSCLTPRMELKAVPQAGSKAPELQHTSSTHALAAGTCLPTMLRHSILSVGAHRQRWVLNKVLFKLRHRPWPRLSCLEHRHNTSGQCVFEGP